MKKNYLILILLLLAGNAFAGDDDLYCCGQKQSSTYNWNYTTSNNIGNAIKMGSISYNASTKTVTFDNVIATVTGDNRIFYNKNVSGLRIVFKGGCTLKSDKCVFRIDKDTEIQGSSEHVEMQALGDGAQCIYCPNETDLTIHNAGQMRLYSKYFRAIHTNGTHVYISWSNISAEGADCAIQNDKGSEGHGSLDLNACVFREPYTESYGSVGPGRWYDGIWGHYVIVHTSEAKSVMIISAEDYLGVRLKGIALTKGWSKCTDPTNPAYDIEDYYTYDESTNTLTLKKDFRAKDDCDLVQDETGILLEKPMTIDGGGHYVYGECGMQASANVTLSNITIAGNEFNGAFISNDCVLTLKDNVIIGGPNRAIYAFNNNTVKFSPSAGKTVTLVPCDEDFKVKSTFDDKPIESGSIQLVDCYVSTPEGGEIGTSGFEVDGNTVRSKVVVTGMEKYNLWVGETQVTSVNASDILGDGGHFRYNASTKTLTISNATFENGPDGTGIKNEISDLTFNIVGTNSFNTRKDAIYTTKSINFTGNGSLNVNVINPSYYCIYLASNDAITCTINGPQLDFTGGSIIYDSRRNATINVTGTGTCLRLHPKASSLAFKNLKALNLGTGLYISEPIGGYFDSNLHGITVNGTALYNGDVVISNVQNRKLGFSINGQEMTTTNMNDVPGVVSGIAYVTTDSNNNPILVLSDAKLEWNDANAALDLDSGTRLTIRVQGDCVINAPDHTGLSLSGNTTIDGGGRLQINSKWAAIETWDNTRFALQDQTTLIAHSSNYYGFVDLGMEYYSTWFIIEDGGLFAAFGAGECNPISMNSDRLVHFDSNIDLRYPVDGQLWNGYVYGADGNEVKNDWAVIGLDTQATDELIDSLTSSSRLGDVNLDGAVDIADAVCILNAMAGQSVAGNANVNGDYDANGNPVIDIADLVTVLNIMAGQ